MRIMKQTMSHIEEIKDLGIKTIHGEDLTDNDLLYIDRLYCAMEKLKEDSLIHCTPLSPDIPVEVVERSYSSKLSTETEILLRTDYPSSNPLGLTCEVEESKTFCKQCFEALSGKSKYPDLYIHKGEVPQKGIQEIICEVKRLSQLSAQNMIKDMNKLMSYSGSEVWECNGYKISAFIVNNGTLNQLKRKIKYFKNTRYSIEDLLSDATINTNFKDFVTINQDRLKNILCFCHSAEGSVELTTIYDVVKFKIQK